MQESNKGLSVLEEYIMLKKFLSILLHLGMEWLPFKKLKLSKNISLINIQVFNFIERFHINGLKPFEATIDKREM